jgi:hypothetical protein
MRSDDVSVPKVSTIEFSLIEISVLHGLKQGNEVLKEIHKEINIESVEKLLDESHEAQAYQQVLQIILIVDLLLETFLNSRKLTKCFQANSLLMMKMPYRRN